MWPLLIPDNVIVYAPCFLSHDPGPAMVLGQVKPGLDRLAHFASPWEVSEELATVGALGKAGRKPLNVWVGGGSSKGDWREC